MNQVIGELLLIALMISATAILALAIAPPSVKPVYEMEAQDAYPPSSTGELFDVIMLSGDLQYKKMNVMLINSSTGETAGEAHYSAATGNFTGSITATTDPDGTFSTGDLLRFRDATAAINPGVYELIITDGKYVVFEGKVRVQ